MKWKFLALILLSSLAFGQTITTQYRFTTSTPDVGTLANGGAANETNSGTQFRKITWTGTGTLATCSVRVDSSSDGVSWTAGGAIAAQTCTSNGASSINSGVFNYTRINVTAISGGGSVKVVYQGFPTQSSGPSATVGGLAGATAGAPAPSPVATSTCIGNPFVWAQNNAGTYQTQFSVDTSAAFSSNEPAFNSPGFLTNCRPIYFNSTGVTPGITYNGQNFNVYGNFSSTRNMSTQWRFENAASDSGTYNFGNINQTYSEFFLHGTPTINTTFVANTRSTIDDFKTGGSKPRVWSAYQAAARKDAAYDITNCTGGIDSFSNGPCYVGFYGEAGVTAGNEDQTGVTFDVFAGGVANTATITNQTGNVFHALVNSSTGARPTNNRGFASEDFGTSATAYDFLAQGVNAGGTPSGFNAFVGPTSFGSTTHPSSGDQVAITGKWSSTDLLRSYNGITTAGLSFPVQTARVRSVAQTSAIGSTTLLANGAADKDYLVVATLYCDSTSAGATVALTISYTDVGNQAQSIAPSAAACTALGSSSFALINSPIAVKASTNITYSTVIANTPTYDLRINLYQMGTN